MPTEEIVKKKIYSSWTFKISKKLILNLGEKSISKSIKENMVWSRQSMSDEEKKWVQEIQKDEWNSHHMFRLTLLFEVSESHLELKIGESHKLLGNK